MELNKERLDGQKKVIQEYLDHYLKEDFGLSKKDFEECGIAMLNSWMPNDNSIPCYIFCGQFEMPRRLYNYQVWNNNIGGQSKDNSLSSLTDVRLYNKIRNLNGANITVVTFVCKDFKLDVLEKLKYKFYYDIGKNKLVFDYKTYQKVM